MMNQDERIILIIKLNSKLQSYGKTYVIKMMHSYMLKEL